MNGASIMRSFYNEIKRLKDFNDSADIQIKAMFADIEKLTKELNDFKRCYILLASQHAELVKEKDITKETVLRIKKQIIQYIINNIKD